jgi:hypothetical protein
LFEQPLPDADKKGFTQTMDPKHPQTGSGDARESKHVPKPPQSPASGEESPVIDSGPSVDETVDESEQSAVASAQPMESNQPPDTPAADSVPATFAEPDDGATLGFQDALDISSPPDAQPLPAVPDVEFPDTASGLVTDTQDFSAADVPPESPGPPSEITSAFDDEPSQPTTPEIVKPADEWPWGSPLWSFQSSAVATDFDVADAAFSPPADSDFDATGQEDRDSSIVSDPVFRPAAYRPGGPSVSPPDEFVVQPAGRRSGEFADPGPSFDASPTANALLEPTSDGGPPLARPTVLVSMTSDETRRLVEEALRAASQRVAKTAGEIAESKVNEALWFRDAQMRAICGDD